MIPLIAFLSIFALLWGLGHLGLLTWVGITEPIGWWDALRFSLAGMFLLTASGHWGRRRPDLVRMVPSFFSRWEPLGPAFLVSATGVLEIFGAIGLMWERAAPLAGLCLGLLLIALFPANVRAARDQIGIAGAEATALLPRTLIQILFLTATLAVYLGAPR